MLTKCLLLLLYKQQHQQQQQTSDIYCEAATEQYLEIDMQRLVTNGKPPCQLLFVKTCRDSSTFSVFCMNFIGDIFCFLLS